MDANSLTQLLDLIATRESASASPELFQGNIHTILADISGEGLANYTVRRFRCNGLLELLQSIQNLPGYCEESLRKLFAELQKPAGHSCTSNPNSNDVLSAKDLAKWREDGYVIVRNVLSESEARLVANNVLETHRMDANNPETWYQKKNGIMLEHYHHDLLDIARKSHKAFSAFATLWQTEDLWVTRDRVSVNPPETAHYRFPGPELHLDVAVRKPLYFATQGILYLNDVSENQGALTVCPGFHKLFPQWLAQLPADANFLSMDFNRYPKKAIAANAGDLIIWHHWLPHGSSPNTSNFPRIAQYLTMRPLEPKLV